MNDDSQPPAQFPIAVLGAGSFGTAMSLVLHRAGHPVQLWARRAEHAEAIHSTRENPDYLPGVKIPAEIRITSDLAEALRGAEIVFFVTPSDGLREVAQQVAAARASCPHTMVSCTKGLEIGTGLRMSEVLQACLPSCKVAVLSGPGHAEEIAVGQPCAVVVGSAEIEHARAVQMLFEGCDSFRVYRNDDLVGIEIGGALKNVYAIAAGISDGLGLGDSSKAALVTRSLVEMMRIGLSLGGQQETFQGLSGIGDLLVTSFSQHSRNHRLGVAIGQGGDPETVLREMHMVAEGYPTTRSLHQQADKLKVRAPVVETVYAVLYEKLPPKVALRQLMDRESKHERE